MDIGGQNADPTLSLNGFLRCLKFVSLKLLKTNDNHLHLHLHLWIHHSYTGAAQNIEIDWKLYSLNKDHGPSNRFMGNLLSRITQLHLLGLWEKTVASQDILAVR